MKEFLSQEGYSFQSRNVEEDEAAYDQLIALGFRSVPVTTIDGQSVVGFQPDELRAALQASSPPKSDR
ncbi:MAG: glutaredoxin family protein [Acidimicrobiia bacterium]